MSNQNKLLIIGAAISVGLLTLTAVSFGVMQFISFRQEQQARAEEQELKDQMAILDAVSEECQDLTQLVNRTQGFMPQFEETIQTFSANAAQVKSLQDIKDAANEYVTAVDGVVNDLDTLTADLESAQIQNEQLSGYRDRYAEMTKGFSTAFAQASDAMSIVLTVQTETALPAKIDESQQGTTQAAQQIQELSTEESDIIDAMNNFCGEVSDQKMDIQTDLLSQ